MTQEDEVCLKLGRTVLSMVRDMESAREQPDYALDDEVYAVKGIMAGERPLALILATPGVAQAMEFAAGNAFDAQRISENAPRIVRPQ